MGINPVKNWLKKVVGVDSYFLWHRIQLEKMRLFEGKMMAERNKQLERINTLEDVEFSVFSQIGDDGIIQYLIHQLGIKNTTFIEFGVQDYIESNTRFLLMNNNWSGMVIDGSSEFIDFIRGDYYFWKFDLKAVNKFLTAENINQVIGEQGFKGEIGLLHIDIDGNDYWVWKALEVVKPVIVVIEYNSCFGKDRAVTVPYNPSFERYDAHFSGIYFGASLKALVDLGKEKGYIFIGCNSYGNDAYFVRKDQAGPFSGKSVDEGYIRSKCRQNKDASGRFTYECDYKMISTYKNLKVVNTITGQIEELNGNG